MIITWHGNFTLKLVCSGLTVVIDPHSAIHGLSAFRGKTDILALSNPASPDMSHLDGIQGEPQIINTPGEYSLSGLTLNARSWHDDNGHELSLQRWHIANIVLLHLGALTRELTEEELQELEQLNIDILFLPIGGHNSLDTKQALSLLTVIEPRLVIPINFTPSSKSSSPLASVTQFAKEMGVPPRKALPRLNISSQKLPAEGMETIILSS